MNYPKRDLPNDLVSSGMDMEAVRQILPEKFRVRGLSLQGVGVRLLKQRRFEFERDWERRLNGSLAIKA